MEIEELLKKRFEVISDYPGSIEEVGEIITLPSPHHVYADENHTPCKEDYFDAYPNVYKRLGWWEERKVDDMPMYVKRMGMVNSFDNPIPDWYFKVKKHFNCGNGEWRLNSSQIFCVEKNEVTIGTGMNYFEFEPATEEEYLSNIAILETIQK